MKPALLQTLIDAADDLIAAIDGTTDQYEDEVSCLSDALSAIESAHAGDRRRSFDENLAAITAGLHTHALYDRFYNVVADELGGFVGIFDVCIAMAGVLSAWEERNGGAPLAYESCDAVWIEIVDDFVDEVLTRTVASGTVPNVEPVLDGLQTLRRRS